MCSSRQRLTIDELLEILNIPPGTIVNSHGAMKAVQVRFTFRDFTSHEFPHNAVVPVSRERLAANESLEITNVRLPRIGFHCELISKPSLECIQPVLNCDIQ